MTEFLTLMENHWACGSAIVPQIMVLADPAVELDHLKYLLASVFALASTSQLPTPNMRD